MAANAPLFSPAHVLIIAAIPLIASGLATIARHKPSLARPIRIHLGAVLFANEVLWYVYRFWREGLRPPAGLPLQLSDIIVWLSAAAALLRSQWAFELSWYWGLIGAGMAVLTPDLWAPLASYPSVTFFIAHGGVLITILFLVWSGLAKPRPGSFWRAFILLVFWAAGVAVFNLAFNTNYMYLCRKPANPSLLDYLGPWPLYILATAPLALAAFWLLWLPFASGARARAR